MYVWVGSQRSCAFVRALRSKYPFDLALALDLSRSAPLIRWPAQPTQVGGRPSSSRWRREGGEGGLTEGKNPSRTARTGNRLREWTPANSAEGACSGSSETILQPHTSSLLCTIVECLLRYFI